MLGRHVPQLQFFEVLLGDQPVLAPEVKLYQRILASDPHEAGELAEEQLEDGRSWRCLTPVVLPALVFADQDRLRGALDPARVTTVAGSLHRSGGGPRRSDRAAATRVTVEARPRVLCVGARTGLDEVAATMLVQLLRQAGHEAEATDAATLLHGGATTAPGTSSACPIWTPVPSGRRAGCCCACAPVSGREIRFCICFWGAAAGEVVEARARTQVNAVATSLAEAVSLALAPAEAVSEPQTAVPSASAA